MDNTTTCCICVLCSLLLILFLCFVIHRLRLTEETWIRCDIYYGGKIKSPSIFVEIIISRINNFSPPQLLKEVTTGEYEIEIINAQINIQLKSSIAYVNIVKELKSKNMEFHTYKLKQKWTFRVVFKHIHATANLMTSKKKLKFQNTYY